MMAERHEDEYVEQYPKLTLLVRIIAGLLLIPALYVAWQIEMNDSDAYLAYRARQEAQGKSMPLPAPDGR